MGSLGDTLDRPLSRREAFVPGSQVRTDVVIGHITPEAVTEDETEPDEPEEPKSQGTTSERPFLGRTTKVASVQGLEVVRPQDVTDPPEGGLNDFVGPVPVSPAL